MNILVIGGTRFFGIPMVEKLLSDGDRVTIATRGSAKDSFGDSVSRIIMDLNNSASVEKALNGKNYDIVIDKMAYCANDIKRLLDNVTCDRFVHMSTAGVYDLNHFDIIEKEFDPHEGEIVWSDRGEFSYDDGKRNAERALAQEYNDVDWVSVRSPFVLGKNDYTNRLLFYVKNVLSRTAMNIDNMDSRFCVAEENELGRFIALLSKTGFTGPINACSEGIVSVRQILEYIEFKSGVKPVLDVNGVNAPYNGTVDNSLNLEKMSSLTNSMSDVNSWIEQLLDYYIDMERIND